MTTTVAALLVGAVLAGCVQTSIVQCDDGRYCPASTTCAATTAGTFCVDPVRLEACVGRAEGEACGTTELLRTCHGGACFDDACGNTLVDATERCDDGNDNAKDDCSLDCQSTVKCGNKIVDAIVGEQCDEGDKLDHDGCSSDCRIETARWELVNTRQPKDRSESPLVYDAKRRRAFLFGGMSSAGALLGDTWEWNGLVWDRRSSLLVPTARAGHQMAYDAAREQVVLFSGRSSPADTWTWDGATWTLQDVTLTPRERNGGAMVYDSKRGRIVLFGGEDNGTPLADTWEWDGTQWALLMPAMSPPARAQASVAYDAARGVVVLFGGHTNSQIFGDTWEFDGTTWAIKPSSGPSPRFRAAMAFDPSSGRVVLVDGEAAANSYPHDAWAWNGTQWQAFDTTSGPSVPGAAMTADPVRGRLVLFDTAANLYERTNAWVKSTSGSFAPGVPALPPERCGHVMVTDTVRRELVVFGGGNGYTQAVSMTFNDTWVWNGQWRRAATTGPSPRMGAAAAFDPIRGETVLFGGCDDEGYPGLADLWTWNGATWTPRVAGPPKRCFAQMAFDKKRGRIVLHGGVDGTTPLGDTWTWDGSSWHQEAAGPVRWEAGFGYDEDHERVVLFGGRTTNTVLLGSFVDTYLWDGTTWTDAGRAAAPPRKTPAMAWDSGRHRLVMYGGNRGSGSVTDAWEWDGATWTLETASQIGFLELHAMAPAPDGAGVFSFGGAPFDTSLDELFLINDLWRLRWDGASSSERCEGTDADGDGLVACADPDCGAVCLSCGNGMCEAGLEQCTSCPADCGPCTASCGDFVCGSGETCAGDCP